MISDKCKVVEIQVALYSRADTGIEGVEACRSCLILVAFAAGQKELL